MEREKNKWGNYMADFRKERANRLINKGALLEKYFECENLSIEETEELLKTFSVYVNEKKPSKFKRKLGE
ncbi:hypothetical protein ACQKDB_15775 [Planococcus kocurii]|uniref:hypothetical protein n=1 Tax=Planococcus kocurii TaxID=1374 RepID=UPI003D01C700